MQRQATIHPDGTKIRIWSGLSWLEKDLQMTDIFRVILAGNNLSKDAANRTGHRSFRNAECRKRNTQNSSNYRSSGQKADCQENGRILPIRN